MSSWQEEREGNFIGLCSVAGMDSLHNRRPPIDRSDERARTQNSGFLPKISGKGLRESRALEEGGKVCLGLGMSNLGPRVKDEEGTNRSGT